MALERRQGPDSFTISAHGMMQHLRQPSWMAHHMGPGRIGKTQPGFDSLLMRAERSIILAGGLCAELQLIRASR